MDLGNVAEWVGAIGTVGTLLLALLILRQDRSIARRRSVDDLITWLSWREVPDREAGVRLETTIHAANTGNKPVHAPLLMFPDRRGGYHTQIISADGRPTMLRPGAELHTVVQGQPRNTVARYVVMTALDWQTWFRKADEHRYPPSLGQAILLVLLLLFERPDGASARRRRARERQPST